jgi:hypothetical protein
VSEPRDPNLSEDGHWRWDGQRWQPVEQQPAGPPPPKGPIATRGAKRWLWIAGGAAVFLLVIGLVRAGSGSGQPTGTAAGPTPTATATTTPRPPASATPAPTPKPAPTPATSFGDGTWRVGADIQPGTYRSTGTQVCYWERVRDFNGALGSIVANDNVSGPAVVTIAPSDAGFSSKRCGTWTRVG